MAGRIHLVRHAEAVHNVDKNFTRIDPELTALGCQQAEALSLSFPHPDNVGLIIASPLRRTIQTTLLAFSNVLDKRYFPAGSGKGVKAGAQLLLDPNLQERSAEPCDTGSDRAVLEKSFPDLDFSFLHSGWGSKTGFYAPDDAAVEVRATQVRADLKEHYEELRGSEKNEIVVVTHGVFMKFLSGDQAIDLPKAGWKSYIMDGDRKDEIVLIPV